MVLLAVLGVAGCKSARDVTVQVSVSNLVPGQPNPHVRVRISGGPYLQEAHADIGGKVTFVFPKMPPSEAQVEVRAEVFPKGYYYPGRKGIATMNLKGADRVVEMSVALQDKSDKPPVKEESFSSGRFLAWRAIDTYNGDDAFNLPYNNAYNANLKPIYKNEIKLDCVLPVPKNEVSKYTEMSAEDVLKILPQECVYDIALLSHDGLSPLLPRNYRFEQDPFEGCGNDDGEFSNLNVFAGVMNEPKDWGVGVSRFRANSPGQFKTFQPKQNGLILSINKEWLQQLTAGNINGFSSYEIPGDSRYLLEVKATRTVSGDGYAEDQPNKKGVFIFVVDPANNQIAQVGSSLGADKCGRGNNMQLYGTIDVNGDGRNDVIIGPEPYILLINHELKFESLVSDRDPCMC